MRRLMAVLAVAVLVGCGGDDGARPGQAVVYEQIEAMTDCAELQESFDRSMDNHDRAASGSAERDWTLGYADAADDRMREIGCYD